MSSWEIEAREQRVLQFVGVGVAAAQNILPAVVFALSIFAHVASSAVALVPVIETVPEVDKAECVESEITKKVK